MDIIYDFNATNKYRDKFNDQCQCNECNNFRLKFGTYYQEIILFLKQFGIDVNYPLEIIDCGFNIVKKQKGHNILNHHMSY